MLAISATLLAGLLIQPALAQQQPPRDPAVRREAPAAPSPREVELAKAIAANPAGTAAYIDLAKLQEERGAGAEAEATLQRARQAAPLDKTVLTELSGFYNRAGKFEQTIAALETTAELTPGDPRGFHTVSVYYWDKARSAAALLPAQQLTYITAGIAADDRALAIDPDYVDALVYKNILLRMRGNLETDPLTRQQLFAEADTLRNRAIELQKTRGIGSPTLPPGMPPPPPPPPPMRPGLAPPGMAPVRVGGTIRQPAKVRDVRPLYPPDAQAERIQGVVIIEATIGTTGTVTDARVLRSIPKLDQAAIDAVLQWEYEPTLLNGVPVPVIMTVTVNFTLQ